MYLCTKFSKRFGVIYPTGFIAHFETSGRTPHARFSLLRKKI